MHSLKDRVRETYRKFFRETRDGAAAWNSTLEAIAGPYDPEGGPKAVSQRKKITQFLWDLSKEVELQEKDPYRLAVRDAMVELRTLGASGAAREAYFKYHQAVVDEVRRAAGFLKTGSKKQDWSPRDIPMTGDTPPKSLEEALERSEPPTLFIPFSEDGQVGGIAIDHPDYFRGWGTATAAITVSPDTDYKEIESAVEEALGELEIWDQETDTA